MNLILNTHGIERIYLFVWLFSLFQATLGKPKWNLHIYLTRYMTFPYVYRQAVIVVSFGSL